MYTGLLKVPFQGASPETKFYLLSLLKHFDLESVITGPVSALSHKLGVSSNVVTKATKYLYENDWLVRKQSTNPMGRPGYRYTFSVKLKALIAKEKKEEVVNEEVINQVLFSTTEIKTTANKKVKLTLSNRLLFAVMLSSADEYGQLDKLSKKDLSNFTGITLVALRSQILKLRGLNLIQSYVPGVRHRSTFGVGKTIYQLKTSWHSNEEQCKLPSQYIIHLQTLSLVRRLFSYSGDIEPPYSYLDVILDRKLIRRVSLILKRGSSENVFRFFAAKLNEYASMVLTKHFELGLSVNSMINPNLVECTKDKIQNELVVLHQNPYASSSAIQHLPNIIHLLACHVANNILNTLKAFLKQDDFQDQIIKVIVYQPTDLDGAALVDIYRKNIQSKN